MNSPCQMKVLYYSFTLDNFNNTDPPIAYRERFIGLNNRVLAGMLVYVERKNLKKCPSSRFDAIDATCSGGRDVSSYGVDPVFKLGTPLYNADYDNYETLTKVYNCSAFEANLGVAATYNDGTDPAVTKTSRRTAPSCTTRGTSRTGSGTNPCRGTTPGSRTSSTLTYPRTKPSDGWT